MNFDVETLENDTFLPDRNYHVEITGVQGGTLNAKEKTVETTIHDNDKPPVPDMREGNEPGSVEITLVPGTNKLVVEYIDESKQSQSITVIDSGNGTWLSAAPLPSDVFLDEQNRKLTLGAKAVLDKSEVRAHNDAYLEGEEALFTAGSENTPPSPPLHEEQPAMQHGGSAELSTETHSGHVTETVAQHYDHDGHGLYVSDGIDATAYSQLVSHSGEDLLNYLGQHSAELLAATKDSGGHELHGSASDDVLVAGHGTQLLEGGAGADTFALLFDSNDAASWHETGKILDFNPQEGDRIVLAGDEHLAHAKLAVSSDADGQHLHISDDAGHTRTIDIASQNDKTPTAGDILSHVEIRTPQGYSEPVYSTPQTPHLPQDDYSHLL